jgi:hypothetical protein
MVHKARGIYPSGWVPFLVSLGAVFILIKRDLSNLTIFSKLAFLPYPKKTFIVHEESKHLV